MERPEPPSSEVDIVETAKRVFGTDDAVQAWMMLPAVGLDRQRPVDLLHTQEGRQTLADFLGRLEFNVYT